MARRQNKKSAEGATFEEPITPTTAVPGESAVSHVVGISSGASAKIGANQEGQEQAPPAGDPIETPSLFRNVGDLGGDRLRSSTSVSLENLDAKALLDLRAQIDARLPALNIADMNLESEVILHYYMAKELAREAATDASVPRNQQAQVMNSCASILKQLADAQTALYTAERVKCVEAAMERAFAGESEPVKKRFYDRYSAALRELAASKDTKNQSLIKEKH